MSWLSDLGSIAKSAVGLFTGNSLGSQIAKTALMGFALNKMQSSMNKENTKPEAASSNRVDNQTREQLVPSVDNAIPVVYGTSFVRGIISDAVMQDQKYMWYCITVCEVTGNLLSTGQPSEISFLDMWINNQRVQLEPDGINVKSMSSDNGVTNTDVEGLIKVYFYKNGSNNPTRLGSLPNNIYTPEQLIPGWTVLHTMSNLAFVIIRLEYNQEKNVTNLGDVHFKISNSMTLPGDCIYDYMTNTRYGAGIPAEEINI